MTLIFPNDRNDFFLGQTSAASFSADANLFRVQERRSPQPALWWPYVIMSFEVSPFYPVWIVVTSASGLQSIGGEVA